ncbi:MAG TPA: 3-oxoacyl-ACP synthase III family protein [Streptosporangiaceae bacterium]|jgi:3-oxoacyl-[acyl-carrier-protein] synthase-3
MAIDNAALARRFSMPAAWEQWIDAFVGNKTRHFAVDLETGEQCCTLADLGETAGQRALAAAGLRPADVDLMVMGTCSPDLLMPTTADVIADRLGIDGIPAFQLQSGCTGAVQALNIAHEMLRSGGYQTALVLGGDCCAKHLDLNIDVTSLSPAEQVNGVLFGDGAGAAVLSTEPGPGSAAIRHVFVRLSGLGRAPGQVVEWFGRADRDSVKTPVTEDYKAIEESVPVMAGEALADLLAALGWDEDDVDYLLPPQLSGVMTTKITKHLDLPGAAEISVVAETGNTGNALPFFQLERALPRMISGDRALAISVESSKWIRAGFALERA